MLIFQSQSQIKDCSTLLYRFKAKQTVKFYI